MRSKHLVPLIGGGKQPLQSINVNDLARIIERVLQPDISGTIVAAHPAVFTYKQFYQTIARVFQIRVFFVPFTSVATHVYDQSARFLHVPLTFSEENIRGLKHLRSVDNAADMTKLGLPLHTSKKPSAHYVSRQ